MKFLLPFSVSLTIVFATGSELSALDQNKAAYAGGTITALNQWPGRVEGRLDLSDPEALVFVADSVERNASLRIEYSSIHDLESGQKVRRRVAAATGITVVLGPVGALAFAMKRREHYLTVVYTDDRGLNQVAVLELGKDIVRSTLLTTEKRWGVVITSTIALTMAERVEVVIDFSRCPLGSHLVLENRRARDPLRRVMRFAVVRRERDDSVVPGQLADVERLQESQAVCTRTFVFGGKPTLGVPPGVRWVINGEAFDPLRVDANPRLDDIEVWRFVNRGFMGQTMLHPVHTHLVPFQILRRNGGAPSRPEAGWKDTVAIEDGEEVDVIIRWSGYRGRYMLHCHNLEHQDHSMMARVDVG